MRSQQTGAATFEDLIFYVDEQHDDFTFYLERDREDTVITELKKRSPPFRRSRTKDTFSFSERVLVKNLRLAIDSLNDSDEFWSLLANPEKNSQYEYLRSRLEARIKELNSEQAGNSLNNLKLLGTADRKALLKIIHLVLKELVNDTSLESKPWIKRELPEQEKAFIQALPDGVRKSRWRNRIFLEQAFPNLIKQTQAGRGLICVSYLGRFLSVTFRKIIEGGGYKAEAYGDQGTRKRYLFSLGEYCEAIYTEVFKKTGSGGQAQGLLVVTGSTNSGKSEIARGLIHKYMNQPGENRRRHLVTFEDPVERFYGVERRASSFPWAAVEPTEGSPQEEDYTPRQKEHDARLLKDALTDALRQTPTVFFVGETRDKEEWRVLLDFAATGHLIVTTAHAGSLVEAMHKIFEALEVRTAADRSEIANKLLGIIHLRGGKIEIDNERNYTNVLFPALWRRTSRGVCGLTSDGLASLLPHRPQSDKEQDLPSCLGRRWFIEQLIAEAKRSGGLPSVLGENFEKPFANGAGIEKRACIKAAEWDLRGV